jgi:heme-degrading monooxygenase HmoA
MIAPLNRKRGAPMNEGPALIHIWEIDPDRAPAAVEHLEQMFKQVVADPGFVSARVLQTPDQTSLAAVIEWRSVEDRHRVEATPEVRDTLQDLHGTANLITRMYHDVADYRA